jgi:hypothetical protein
VEEKGVMYTIKGEPSQSAVDVQRLQESFTSPLRYSALYSMESHVNASMSIHIILRRAYSYAYACGLDSIVEYFGVPDLQEMCFSPTPLPFLQLLHHRWKNCLTYMDGSHEQMNDWMNE